MAPGRSADPLDSPVRDPPRTRHPGQRARAVRSDGEGVPCPRQGTLAGGSSAAQRPRRSNGNMGCARIFSPSRMSGNRPASAELIVSRQGRARSHRRALPSARAGTRRAARARSTRWRRRACACSASRGRPYPLKSPARIRRASFPFEFLGPGRDRGPAAPDRARRGRAVPHRRHQGHHDYRRLSADSARDRRPGEPRNRRCRHRQRARADERRRSYAARALGHDLRPHDARAEAADRQCAEGQRRGRCDDRRRRQRRSLAEGGAYRHRHGRPRHRRRARGRLPGPARRRFHLDRNRHPPRAAHLRQSAQGHGLHSRRPCADRRSRADTAAVRLAAGVLAASHRVSRDGHRSGLLDRVRSRGRGGRHDAPAAAPSVGAAVHRRFCQRGACCRERWSWRLSPACLSWLCARACRSRMRARLPLRPWSRPISALCWSIVRAALRFLPRSRDRTRRCGGLSRRRPPSSRASFSSRRRASCSISGRCTPTILPSHWPAAWPVLLLLELAKKLAHPALTARSRAGTDGQRL